MATGIGTFAPNSLPERWRELYEERAAIREYDGGQTREYAEAEAMKEIVAAWRREASEAQREVRGGNQ